MIQHHIVVDLGFGDSGKGAITDRLVADNPGCVVIRYTGGSQAAHNVVIGEKSHIHSSFASGTLSGAHGHMSEYCPLSPGALVVEAEVLEGKLGKGTLKTCSVDPLCPLITPYDKIWNQTKSRNRGASDTTGVGIGAAMYRQEASPHRVFAVDLLYPALYERKLSNVREWYKAMGWGKLPAVKDLNLEPHYKMLEHVELIPTAELLAQHENVPLIFEGAQGVLLDRDHGFFPDVTYGHTTMRNAVAMLSSIGSPPAGIQYVTRAYHTRHGDGPIGSGTPLDLPDTSNKDNEWQGPFRAATIDMDLLGYAFMANNAYAQNDDGFELNITCADRLPDFDPEPFVKMFCNHQVRSWYGADRNAQCIEHSRDRASSK